MDERRNYSRISTRIRAYARVCSVADDEPRFSMGPPSASPSATLDGAKLPGPVVEFLTALDRKLDTLLAYQALDGIVRDYPMELDVRELAGSGLRFSRRADLEPGTTVEVVMMLRQAPLKLVAAKGRVLDDDRGNTRGIEFTSIRETDQEAVISFVFEEEREHIRKYKKAR